MSRNLHRLAGAQAALAADALSGPCGIGACRGPSVGYIQGASSRPVGVCAEHADGAQTRGYTVHREVPSQQRSPRR